MSISMFDWKMKPILTWMCFSSAEFQHKPEWVFSTFSFSGKSSSFGLFVLKLPQTNLPDRGSNPAMRSGAPTTKQMALSPLEHYLRIKCCRRTCTPAIGKEICSKKVHRGSACLALVIFSFLFSLSPLNVSTCNSFAKRFEDSEQSRNFPSNVPDAKLHAAGQ